MKKIKSLPIIFFVCGMVLSSCGSSTSDTSESTSQETEELSTTASEAEEADSASAESEITADSVTIAEQELYNENGIKITTTGLGEDGLWGPEVKLLIENDSPQNITVQVRNGSVNGYMIDYQMSCDVAAGKKSNDGMELSETELENSGIETIADLEFSFHIFDSESWDTIVDTDIIKLGTSASGNYTQPYDDSGEVVYDENNIRIISKGLVIDDDDIFGPRYFLYIENNSAESITVQARDTSINGFMVDPTLSAEVSSGKKIVTDITFMSSQLEENNITEITEIETAFHIFQTDSWDTIVDTPPVMLNCN